MELSKETRRQRRSLARQQLKQHYMATAHKSVCDKACAKLDPGSANFLRHVRNQRSSHLRHVHLARAFLREQPRCYVEGRRSRGYRVYSQYIADIINGMLVLDVIVQADEVEEWMRTT
jgi:hypothetical protein